MMDFLMWMAAGGFQITEIKTFVKQMLIKQRES